MLWIGLLLLSTIEASPQTYSNVSIIIVGSGPSGIAAATRLLKNNFNNIKIIEAENRIGGRINSVKFGDAYVDLGAEYCHGQEDNPVYLMVKELNILKHSPRDSRFFTSDGKELNYTSKIQLQRFANDVAASVGYPDKCENLKSVGECLDIRSQAILNSTNNDIDRNQFLGMIPWIDGFLTSYDSPFDLHDLRIITEYKTCNGDLYMNWNGLGYKTILEIMMQKFPDNSNALSIDDKILLNKTVQRISNWNDSTRPIVVTTNDGEEHLANYVIFTPSLGVLKATHKQLFHPSLADDKADAIKRMGFGAILKVIMHFPERWWDENEHNFAFIWTLEDIEEIKKEGFEWLINLNGFAEAENNPNVIVAWYSGSHIPEIERLPMQKVIEGQKLVINKFLSKHYNVTLPDKYIRTTWYSNPHFRGTYSYESINEAPYSRKYLHKKLQYPLTTENGSPRVLFAGEATHPHFFSTVHGAIESGYREAERISKLFQK